MHNTEIGKYEEVLFDSLVDLYLDILRSGQFDLVKDFEVFCCHNNIDPQEIFKKVRRKA